MRHLLTTPFSSQQDPDIPEDANHHTDPVKKKMHKRKRILSAKPHSKQNQKITKQAPDVGQGYTGSKNRWSGPGNWTLDQQKDHAARSGNWTLDPQKRSSARPGVQTLDQPKRSFVWLCTRSLNAIAHTIVKLHMRTKYAQMHEWVPHGMCPLDDRQRPDQPKNDNGQTVLEMTNHPKRLCSLQNISFSRYHIMYQITYIFTGWIILQQDVCRIHTKKCSSCPFTW